MKVVIARGCDSQMLCPLHWLWGRQHQQHKQTMGLSGAQKRMCKVKLAARVHLPAFGTLSTTGHIVHLLGDCSRQFRCLRRVLAKAALRQLAVRRYGRKAIVCPVKQGTLHDTQRKCRAHRVGRTSPEGSEWYLAWTAGPLQGRL